METGSLAPDNPQKRVISLNRGGRPLGSKNKLQLAAKEAIAEAATKLGGTNRLVEWARENEKNEYAFWAIVFPKLLPLQVTGDIGLHVTWPVQPPKLETVERVDG